MQVLPTQLHITHYTLKITHCILRIVLLRPQVLVEGSVLRLRTECERVCRDLTCVLHTLTDCLGGSGELLTNCHLVARRRRGSRTAYMREIGISGIGCGCRTVHVAGAVRLCDFAREMVYRVEISDFCHSRSAIGSQRVSLCSTMRPMLPALCVTNLHFVPVCAAVPLCCKRGKGVNG